MRLATKSPRQNGLINLNPKHILVGSVNDSIKSRSLVNIDKYFSEWELHLKLKLHLKIKDAGKTSMLVHQGN